jgi:hypothetical protein
MIAGAGLGSSAAMSVCFSSSLLLYSAQVSSTKCIMGQYTKYVYIESTTVYVPSSELGDSLPPTPLSPANVPLPPEPGGGGGTLACV